MFVRCEPLSFACMERTNEVFFGMVEVRQPSKAEVGIVALRNLPTQQLSSTVILMQPVSSINSVLLSVEMPPSLPFGKLVNVLSLVPHCTAGENLRYSGKITLSFLDSTT
jgi:hypothetical protein